MIRLIASWFSSIALGLLVAGPLAAMGVCALLDRAPDGEVRASLFPVAIAALDPFVWACVRNSVVVAGLAASTAMVAGVVVGRLIGDRAFRLRGPALLLLTALAATPSVALAMGASAAVGDDAATAWSTILSRSERATRHLPADAGWLLWLLAASLPGAAAATLAYAWALDRLDPAWRDAARLAGADGTRAWRRLAWPLLRPAMARVGGLVFAVTLADPGPPLILGLRRTLGFQMASAAFDAAPFPRLAVLGLLALLACATARATLRLWAGPTRLVGPPRRDRDGGRARPAASWPRVVVLSTLLGSGAILAAVPLGGLARAAFDGGESGFRSAAIVPRLADPAVTRLLFRSIVLGLGVAILAAISGRALGGLEAGAGPAASGRFRRLARLLAPPPMVAGVVVLAFGFLIGLAAETVDSRSSIATRRLVEGLDGERLGLATVILGVWLATVASRLDGRRPPLATGTAECRDAATLAGAGRSGARRLARGGFGSGRWRAAAATVATAAVNVAPAVVLASSAHSATIGPGLLLFHERPGGGAAIAASLALIATAANLASAFLDPDEPDGRTG
ncbi:hypothetical protein [Planctomyces sp. SH-PL62]|uniref:hypothetical protein n=1 Tax=Planctomyces sp. SH-PL62 TaxID=1636152 RepID=UPI0012E96A69|nr:hypothetical protein [Planctomyces sp. SH-PL62]